MELCFLLLRKNFMDCLFFKALVLADCWVNSLDLLRVWSGDLSRSSWESYVTGEAEGWVLRWVSKSYLFIGLNEQGV